MSVSGVNTASYCCGERDTAAQHASHLQETLDHNVNKSRQPYEDADPPAKQPVTVHSFLQVPVRTRVASRLVRWATQTSCLQSGRARTVV